MQNNVYLPHITCGWIMVVVVKDNAVTLSPHELKLLYGYALTHCRESCPAERNAETCVLMFKLSKLLGITLPCSDTYGNFTVKVFQEIIREIEERHGVPIAEFLEKIKASSSKSLQDIEDEIDGKFALEVLRILKGEQHAMP